ncbi:MAG: hypothetical protein WBG66_02710 [Geitlerinemataceae cyanobacterium]
MGICQVEDVGECATSIPIHFKTICTLWKSGCESRVLSGTPTAENFVGCPVWDKTGEFFDFVSRFRKILL